MIFSVINKYIKYFDKDDLYQVGMIGLINAFNNYKDNMNTKFSTYAYFYILGEVKKYIRESKLIKVSKELSKLNVSVEKAKDVLSLRLGKEPSDYDIALFLEIDVKDVIDAKCANLLLKSLDYESEENNLYDYVGYEEEGYNINNIMLKDEIERLGDDEKKLIYERFKNGLSQAEVAKMMGISQVSVSRLEKDVLIRLRTRMQ